MDGPKCGDQFYITDMNGACATLGRWICGPQSWQMTQSDHIYELSDRLKLPFLALYSERGVIDYLALVAAGDGGYRLDHSHGPPVHLRPIMHLAELAAALTIPAERLRADLADTAMIITDAADIGAGK